MSSFAKETKYFLSIPNDQEQDWSRGTGDPDLPFFRTDLYYQYVNSNLDGIDGRIEVGYGPWAMQVRHTRYEESDPADRLNLTSIHGLLRLSEDNRFELGLGLGSLLLDGERHTCGFSITCPINWYPHRRMAIRMVPTMSWLGGSPIGDYDISIGYARTYFIPQCQQERGS